MQQLLSKLKPFFTIASAILIVFMVISSPMAATISGSVTNADDKTPISKVTIFVPSTGKSYVADELGNFNVPIIDGEEIAVTISCVGFQTLRNVTMKAGEANAVALTPVAINNIGNIVVTANRYEKDDFQVSQPVTSANAEEIQSKGHVIVTDVIKNFPGVDVNDAGPFRARPVIRGLYGTRVLVLVDGQRLNDQRDDKSFAGASLSLIDPSNIERVEVVNGPTSVLYGSDAMAGVINIITRQNQFRKGLNPTASYVGRYSTNDGQSANRFDLGLESDRFAASFGIQYREAVNDIKPPKGWNTDPQFHVYSPEFYSDLNAARGTNYTGDRLVNSHARVSNYDGKFAFKISDRHRLDVDGGMFRGSDIGLPGVPNDSTPYLFEYPRHDRDNISLKYTGYILTNRLARLESRVYYEKISKDFHTDFLSNLVIPIGGPPNFPTLVPQISLTSNEVVKYGWNFQELYEAHKNLHLAFGWDLLREEITGHSQSVSKITGFGPDIYDTSHSSPVPKNRWHSGGIYGTGEFRTGKFQVNGGLRYDKFWIKTYDTPSYVDASDAPLPTVSKNFDALNRSVGVVYTLTKHVNLVGNYGSAFRAPNVVELFYYGSASGHTTRPNLDVKPEKSYTFDCGVKGTHPHADYSMVGFTSKFSDFTQLNSLGVVNHEELWQYQNYEKVTISGIEAITQLRLDNGMYSNIGFTYQRGVVNKSGAQTVDRPLFVSPVRTTLALGYRHGNHGLTGEVNVRRVEKQTRVPGSASNLDDIPTPSFTVFGASIGMKLFDRVSLTLTGANLFNEIYSEPFNARTPDNPIPEPGRNLIISLRSSL